MKKLFATLALTAAFTSQAAAFEEIVTYDRYEDVIQGDAIIYFHQDDLNRMSAALWDMLKANGFDKMPKAYRVNTTQEPERIDHEQRRMLYRIWPMTEVWENGVLVEEIIGMPPKCEDKIKQVTMEMK